MITQWHSIIMLGTAYNALSQTQIFRRALRHTKGTKSQCTQIRKLIETEIIHTHYFVRAFICYT